MTEHISAATLRSILSFYEESIASLHGQLTLPFVQYPLLSRLLSCAENLLMSEPTVLHIDGTVVVVGDLHGHLPDLLRILREVGCPPRVRYLFIGDFVDRGEFSTETVVLILTMKLLWPESLFLLRGNHEFPVMWSEGGFDEELARLYPSKNAGALFERVFSMLPIAAIVNRATFCVHGGISPFTKVETLSVIERPILTFDDFTVSDALWSDPCELSDGCHENPRGLGCLYGSTAVDTFLKDHEFTLLVRGHEAVEGGCLFQFDNRVLTVFSASAYCSSMQNRAGIAILTPTEEPYLQTFPPLRYIRRQEASFVLCRDEGARRSDCTRRLGTARKITRPVATKHSAEWLITSRALVRGPSRCDNTRGRRRLSGSRSRIRVRV
jgi:protein phosphatase